MASTTVSVTGASVAMFRSLFQGHQIRGDSIEIMLVEVHRRHQNAGFEVGRAVNKRPYIRSRHRNRPRGERASAGKMRQVRAEAAGRDGVAHRMTADACIMLEYLTAFGDSGIL